MKSAIEICNKCDGRGYIRWGVEGSSSYDEICSKCQGTGRVVIITTIKKEENKTTTIVVVEPFKQTKLKKKKNII
jgi:DnaJ-class molecular chaperone